MILGVAGILYGAILAFAQTDLKRLVAYTSVNHMGFIVLGVFAFNEMAYQGVVMQMIAHGISTGALFIISGQLYERMHTRDLRKMGGLWEQVPAMGAIGLVFVMASLGLPGLGNFIAEFLTLNGVFKCKCAVCLPGQHRTWFLPPFIRYGSCSGCFMENEILIRPMKDLSLRELFTLGAMVDCNIIPGLFPATGYQYCQTGHFKNAERQRSDV